MGNISPRQSKSYHDGFTNHLTLTPNRSSWKKQLQIINDTFNIKKFSLRHHTQKKIKHQKLTINENNHNSFSIQNFSNINKTNQQDLNVKKSASLFTIKQQQQPLIDSTNKENSIKQISNSNTTNNLNIQHRKKSKNDFATVTKRHSTTYIPPSYHFPKSQSQYYQVQLSSNKINHYGLSTNSKSIQSFEKTNNIIITRKTLIQASTTELLRCLSEYLCSSCSHLLPNLDPIDCIIWIKSADRQLILQGWQEQVFVNPANIVFFYLILRDTLTYIIPSITIKTVSELHSITLTCLYLAFSYMGNEITYPLKPFLTNNETRNIFWQRIVLIMEKLSSKMLAINQNPKFFTECFSDLKKYNLVY